MTDADADAATDAPAHTGGRLDRARAVGAWANSLVDDLTPGQRWTSALALLVAVAILSFGLPSATVVRRGPIDESPGRRAAARTGRAPAAARPPAVPPLPAGVSVEGPADVLTAPPRFTASVSVPPGEAPPPPAPVVTPSIVAVVRSGDALELRDDAAVADAFLANARFDAKVLTLSEDAGFCDQVVKAGQVVIASRGLPDPLTDCLLANRVTVIAYDELGDRPPVPGSGQVLSTRRGDRASLLDLGRWAQSSGALNPAPGLVVSEAYRAEVDAAVSELGALGIQFEQVAYIPEGLAQGPAVFSAVQAFGDAGVETILFAADVEDQSRWVQMQELFGGPVSYVVSDVGDGVVNEGYPSFFTDAVAHTSLASPWRERAPEGETPQQTECRSHWEANAPPGPAGDGELVTVYAWCQHVRLLVEPALDLVEAGVPFEDALRRLVVESPLTSQLGPIGDGGWGPRLDIVLQWDGGCGCWAPQGGFKPR